jgi:hypothetical protein
VPVYRCGDERLPRFFIAYYRNGQRVRQSFSTIDEAKREAQVAARQIAAGLAKATGLSIAEREAYDAAKAILEAAGIPLLSAVEEYAQCRKILEGKSLLAAVSDYAQRNKGVRIGAKLPDLIEEFLAAKKQDGATSTKNSNGDLIFKEALRFCGVYFFTADGISVDAITTRTGESGTREQILKAFPLLPTSARMPPALKFCKDEETGTRSDMRLGIPVVLTYPALFFASLDSLTKGNSGAIEVRAKFFVIILTLRLKSSIANSSRHIFQCAFPPERQPPKTHPNENLKNLKCRPSRA